MVSMVGRRRRAGLCVFVYSFVLSCLLLCVLRLPRVPDCLRIGGAAFLGEQIVAIEDGLAIDDSHLSCRQGSPSDLGAHIAEHL